jgi:hypothetical protein
VAVGLKSTLPAIVALVMDPVAELVAIDGVGPPDVGITVAFDVLDESAEPLLPPLGVRVPGPAGQVLESTLPIGLKGAFGPVLALLLDPRTEPVAVDRVGLRDPSVTVAFDVVQQLAEPLLPPRGVGVPYPAGQVL